MTFVLGPGAMCRGLYTKRSFQCAVCGVVCAVYSVLCAYCSVQFDMYSDQCAVCGVHFIACSVHMQCVACGVKITPISISDKSPGQGKHHVAIFTLGLTCYCRNSSDLTGILKEFEINLA